MLAKFVGRWILVPVISHLPQWICSSRQLWQTLTWVRPGGAQIAVTGPETFAKQF
jgi:hypothetical protein